MTAFRDNESALRERVDDLEREAFHLKAQLSACTACEHRRRWHTRTWCFAGGALGAVAAEMLGGSWPWWLLFWAGGGAATYLYDLFPFLHSRRDREADGR